MGWTIAWAAWLIAFFVIEIPAIRNDLREDTLSEHVRRWFAVDTKLGRTAFLVAWVGFAAWFGVHILTGTV